MKYVMNVYTFIMDRKGKVHRTTCHEGTEGEYMYSFTLSLTSALRLGFIPGSDSVPIV